MYSSLEHGYRLIAGASEGASLFESPGVQGAIVPAASERSVFNAVTYQSAGALEEAYGELEGAYREAGANWTVWVHPGDAAAAALLRERGHVLDAEPPGMVRSLRHPPARPPLEDWTDEGSMEELAALNDLAYGYDGSFGRALSAIGGEGVYVYVAHRDGRPAGGLIAADDGLNTDIGWVAVRPDARGHGLSGKLIAHALVDAAERGRQASTLVATALGRPVYERLGYEEVGAFQMWERSNG